MPSSNEALPEDGDAYDFRRDHRAMSQLALLSMGENNLRHGVDAEETRTAPLFSQEVAEITKRQIAVKDYSYPFTQYGLLAGRTRSGGPDVEGTRQKEETDPRIFLNVSAPWSAFICGSQGSGKSHSLACMLENCLVSHKVLGSLPHPLTAVVFHYDPLASVAGQVCEAVYLCSPNVEVRVLVSPTSYHRMARLYGNLEGLPPGCKVVIEPLILKEEYLDVERVKTFMVTDGGEGLPLYMHSVFRVLREMALEPGAKPGIDFLDFRTRVEGLDLTLSQKIPLGLRMDLLQEFIEDQKVRGRKQTKKGNNWEPVPGRLTIIDLSCHFLDVSTACTLFDIYLGVFLEQKLSIGRLVALDEAHKVWTYPPSGPLFPFPLIPNLYLHLFKTNLSPFPYSSWPIPRALQNLPNLCYP